VKWQTVKKMDAKGKIIPSGSEFNFQHYVVNLECSNEEKDYNMWRCAEDDNTWRKKLTTIREDG